MDKYIGFDIDCKKVVACVVQKGKREIYQTIGPDIGSMRKFLISQPGLNPAAFFALDPSASGEGVQGQKMLC